MLKSMTGYGRGEYSKHNRKFVVEIKSVNHRYNDINIKIPRVMNSCEEDLRKMLSQKILRGKTDVYVSFETFSQDDIKITVNETLADVYVNSLREIQTRYKLNDELSVELVAKFPDVITVDKSQTDSKALMEMWEVLESAAAAALDQFIKMRSIEGMALKDDLLKKLVVIENLSGKIEERAPQIKEEYSAKLTAKVKEALEGVIADEARLLTEVTLFVDKSCLDEEITRLKSHISQMRTILDEKEAVGRKLDFLVQEMNRETNTMGSKANDIEISKFVVELKSEIEKIREQIQNIE